MSDMEIDQVEAFWYLFRGRTDAWGSVEGRSNKEPVSIANYEEHLEGLVSLGVYPLLDDGTCYFFAVDLDEKDFNKAKAIRQELKNMSVNSYIAHSKSKGFHIFGFAEESFIARDIRKVLHHVLEKLNIRAEVFPKQDTLTRETPLGNYINLPCFGSTRQFLSGDFQEVPLKTALSRIKETSRENIDKALKAIEMEVPQGPSAPLPVTRTQTGRLPCFEKMMAGVPEGCRDEVAFRLAIHLFRQGMPLQLVEATLLKWDADYNKPAIGTNAIRIKIKQAFSGKYGLGCLNDLIKQFCEKDCPVYRRRHTEVDRRKTYGDEGKELDIMGLSRLGTSPASFHLTIDGSSLKLSSSELLSLRKVKSKAIESLSYVPFPGMKATEWEVLINSLLEDVTQEEAPADASLQAHYIECIYDWLETAPEAERQEDVEAGRPVKREDGYYFRMKDAVNYLVKHHRINVDPSELYGVVRDASGGTKTIRVGKLFKLWYLPLKKEEEEEQSADMEV